MVYYLISKTSVSLSHCDILKASLVQCAKVKWEIQTLQRQIKCERNELRMQFNTDNKQSLTFKTNTTLYKEVHF